MEKRTLLAIVLSSAVMFIWFLFIQPTFFPVDTEQNSGQTAPAAASPAQPPVAVTPLDVRPADPGEPAADGVDAGIDGEEPVQTSPIPVKEERIVIETDLVRVILSSAGGDIISCRLKAHSDKDELVEMVLPSIENGAVKESHAFTIAFGGQDARPIQDNFRISRPDPLTVDFSRDFSVAGYPGTFALTKRYEFKNGEYMFKLTVAVAGKTPLNFGSSAYTLSFGPQMGPNFQKLDNRYEYREYLALTNGKRSKVKLNTANNNRFTWAGIAGKYFAAIVVPDNTLYTLSFSDKSEPGINSVSRMYLVRPPMNNAVTSDVYHFYLGPKNQENLGRYDTGDNSFKLRELDFTKAASSSGILAPLEKILKWGLKVFFNWVGNYGVAIILLTLVTKILLFPLTKKSSEASIKMQALAPKIKEIQAKYKDNPAKMNAEMGALYKKEGHNPMSGCLPLLIQMPLLFAMYNLFNNHFDLRGAMFIPGWIPDLSLPESVWDFGARIPLLGWESLRLLPFIYVGSQLLYGFATRTPEQQGNPSMKMMLYVMPIAFFFILYNVPSGLLVFWIMSNLFTLIQQIILNKYLMAKKAAAAVDEPPPVIAPPRKKKR